MIRGTHLLGIILALISCITMSFAFTNRHFYIFIFGLILFALSMDIWIYKPPLEN